MSQDSPKRAVASKTQFFKIASAALRDAWTDFVLSRQAMQCTKHTMAFYQKMLSGFLDWLEEQGITEPQQVTARHVRQYLAQFADKSDWYLNGKARAVRTLLRFWHREGYLPQPVTFEMPKIRQKRLPFLTAEQIQTVLAACGLREKALIMLFADSGLRISEVCNLNRCDVDITTGAVVVRQGKGRKDRLSAIGATTRRTLLAYMRTAPDQEDSAPLFQTRDGRRFSVSGLQSFFCRLSRKTGVKVSAHRLRRSFATLALQNGIDLVSLQLLLGHNSLETTRRYIQWLDSDLLEAHRASSPIDNLVKQSGRKK